MKSLKHNGIYVPKYEKKVFKIKIRGQIVPLTEKSEQMAIAWIRKTMSLTTPPDKVFMKNFMQEFLEQLKQENPTLQLLTSFTEKYLKSIDAAEPEDVTDPEYLPASGLIFQVLYRRFVFNNISYQNNVL